MAHRFSNKDIAQILDNDKWAKSTLVNRASVVTRVLKDLGLPFSENLSSLNNHQQIIDLINSGKNNQTKRAKFIHLASAQNYLKSSGINPAADPAPFQREADNLSEAYNAHYANNVMPEQFASKFIPLAKLKAAIKKKLTAICKQAKGYSSLDRNQKITFCKEFHKLVILGLYTLQPPLRNDYAALKIVDTRKDFDKDSNYIAINQNTVILCLNKYKTAKTYGQRVIPIEDKMLAKSIRAFTKVNEELLRAKPEYAFGYHYSIRSGVYNTGNSSIQALLPKWSKEIFGKDLGINDYRHIYEITLQRSDEYQMMTEAQKEAEHMKLLHSGVIARAYNFAGELPN
jgi:hypothetical protein